MPATELGSPSSSWQTNWANTRVSSRNTKAANAASTSSSSCTSPARWALTRRGRSGLSRSDNLRRDRQGQAIGLWFVAVGQDDHRQVALWVTHYDVAEADGLAGMPQGFARDAPAEPVFHLCVVRVSRRREGGLQRARTQQSAVVQSGIPLRQVIDRRIDPAIAEHRTRLALIGSIPAAILLRVTERAVAHRRDAFFMSDRVAHSERLEDALAQERRESPARGALHDQREQRIATVAVPVAAAGLEVGSILRFQ